MEKIMIIEDEYIVAQSMSFFLESKGYEVCGIADRYESAVRTFISYKPNLVLCDIRLKGEKTGIDVIKELRKSHVFHLIYITAHGAEQLLKEALSTHPNAFLLKPYTDQQLLVSVQMAFKTKEANHDNFSEHLAAFQSLSKGELRIVSLMVEGKSSSEIAETLFISKHTVDVHRKNILRKTDFKNTVQLIVFILEHRLLEV